MPKRRQLKADYAVTETEVNVRILVDSYHKCHSIVQELNGRHSHVVLTDKAMDDLYAALKRREAHKLFLAGKYGDDA
jgi:hypothetical protein